MSNEENKIDNSELKYILYLDREKMNKILFDLDVDTTCEKILTQNKDSITDILNAVHKKSIDDCEFLISENRINKKIDEIPSLMEFKIKKQKKLYNLLINNQNSLFLLPKRMNKRTDRLKARNESLPKENCYDLAETNYFLNKNNEEYLSKTLFYLYDSENQVFNKEKGSVDKQKITIYKSSTNKEQFEINIKNIIKDLYYSDTSQAPYKKNLPIKGDKPKFYIEIVTNMKTYFFGQFKESLNNQWEKAIKKSIIKYKSFNIELNLDIKINSLLTGLYIIHRSIMDGCSDIKNVLFNEEKRKMFLSIFSEKKICSIIINILTYKDLLRKEDYLEAWMRFKEILTYIDSYDSHNKNSISNTKDEKILKIFTQEKINNYRNISDASNENVKKINMANASLSLFQIEMKRALHKILKEDLFDDIFISLYKIYIIPFFKEAKNILEKGVHPTEKPLIRQKFQLLLAIYFNKIFNTSTENFDDIFSTINNQNGFIKTYSLSNEIIC